MDYEKAYKEALERARRAKNSEGDWRYYDPYEIIPALEEIFPELKESEDERLRKLLVWQVHRNIEDETNDLKGSVYDGIKGHDPALEESIEDWKKCLSYLEKQKEQKPLMCDGEIEDKKRDIVAAIRKYYPADYAEYLTSFLKRLSPEDNSDDEYGQEMLGIAYKLMHEHIPENLRTQEFWDSLKFMREYTGKVAIIYSYEKPTEWSEEDEVEWTIAIGCLERTGFKKSANWLKSLPERLSLRSKQEWSEEDERMRNQLIYDVEHYKKEGLISAKQNKATKALYNGIEECYDEKIAWLKSLRPQPKQQIPADTEVLLAKLVNLLKKYRIGEETAKDLANRIADTYGVQRYMDGLCDGMKNNWKPSEEQMKAVDLAISFVTDDFDEHPTLSETLRGLYNDLKKLI